MNRNRHDAVPRWRRRLALIGGAFGLLLLNLAFVVLPVAADGHSGRDGNRHDGQSVEAEHHGNDMDANRHDDNAVNDDRGNDANDVNDDRGNDANDNDVNDDRGNDANDNDVNDDRGNDGMQQVVLLPKVMKTASGR